MTVDVSKRLRHAPALMCLHLKRFVPDWARQRINKRGEKIMFPEVLDMYKHMSDE